MKDKIINYKFSFLNLSISPLSIIRHPLFSGSMLMIIGSNMGNAFAYLYHLVIGRLLGPVDYGELAAAISLLGLFTVTLSFFGVVVVKFISSAEEGDVEKILSWFTKKSLLLSVTGGMLILIVSPLIAKFLHARTSVIILIGPILATSVLSLVFRSSLQGLVKFKQVVILNNFELLLRLLLGALFVAIGYSVFGAFFAIFAASVLTVILSMYYLKNYRLFGISKKFKDGRKVLTYSLPILVSSVAANSFFSTDVLLVKHFFNAHDAGIYASLSILGKIIFFGASPVASVMFPLISKRHSQGKSYKKLFFLSFLMTALIAGGVEIVYLLIPDLSIKLLYGSKYLEASPLLFSMGLFMSIFTLASLVLSYYLSKNSTKVVIFAVIGAVTQAVGIWFFHSTLPEVIMISTVSASLFLGFLLIYFGYESKAKLLKKS